MTFLRTLLKRKIKRWLCGVAAMFTIGLVLLNVLAYRHAFAMMHFTSGHQRTDQPEQLGFTQKIKVLLSGVNIPRPQTTASLLELGPATRSLRVDCTNGISLGAWYAPAPDADRLVILFHGYTAEKSSMLPEAKAFLAMGCSVLLVDFRGSGDSSESYTTIGFAEAEDVAAAMQYARSYLPHRQIILYGQSMGAAAVLCSIERCGVQPDVIIIESVFDRLLNTVRHRFEAMGVPSFPSAELLVFWGGYQAGFNGFSHNPVEYAKAVRCPALFLHGGADPRAHVDEARRVFAVVQGRKTFKEFSHIGHESPVVRYPEEWKKTIQEFLDEGDVDSNGIRTEVSGTSRR